MKLAVCRTIAVAVAMAHCTAAQAQPRINPDPDTRSRVDVEFGGWALATQPGLVMGATGWMSDHSGVAVRGIFVPGSTMRAGSRRRGFETQYRHRGFVRNVEIDFGIGLMFLKAYGEDPATSMRFQRGSRWLSLETTELLVGPRLPGRFGVKAGLGFHSAFLRLQRGGEDLYADLFVKLVVVAPLGERR